MSSIRGCKMEQMVHFSAPPAPCVSLTLGSHPVFVLESQRSVSQGWRTQICHVVPVELFEGLQRRLKLSFSSSSCFLPEYPHPPIPPVSRLELLVFIFFACWEICGITRHWKHEKRFFLNCGYLFFPLINPSLKLWMIFHDSLIRAVLTSSDWCIFVNLW